MGDTVIIRNYQKSRKFQPTFHPDKFLVTEIKDHGRRLELERERDGKLFSRHPDDVKRIDDEFQRYSEPVYAEPEDKWKELPIDEYGAVGVPTFFRAPEQHQLADHIHPTAAQGIEEVAMPMPQGDGEVRRSNRQTKAPERLGAQAYDANQPLRGEGNTSDPWWPGFKQGEWKAANAVQPWGQTIIRRGMMYTDV